MQQTRTSAASAVAVLVPDHDEPFSGHGEPPLDRRSRKDLQVPSAANASGSRLLAVGVTELRRLRAQLGTQAAAALMRQVEQTLVHALPGSRSAGVDRSGHVLIVRPGRSRGLDRRLGRAIGRVAATTYIINGERLRVTPSLGHTLLRGVAPNVAESRALVALGEALRRGDMVPVAWSPRLGVHAATTVRIPEVVRAGVERLRTPAQVLATFAVGIGLPLVGYSVSERLGLLHMVMSAVYGVVVVGALATVAAVTIEGLLALDPRRPPAQAVAQSPPATAIISAYLPNESATIIDTIEVLLAMDYPAGLQVIVAYNAPHILPIERTIADLAARHARLVVLRVEGSTSKAQNVNAALSVATGDVIGLFDADHHPEPGSFERAWQWIANGYAVVQGHCIVRNGDASWVSRMVAVEFEAMYAVSHPGRAELHGYGIFGGSNGYWRADLLRAVRMRGSMLTEDIDSSLRVTLRGEKIASDPGLLSRELAPTRLGALAGQRLRWAQGWTQVSLEYLGTAMRSRRLSRQQKAGLLFMLGWRELYPWLSLQIVPLLAFALTHRREVPVDWTIPLFVFSSVTALSLGPVQTILAYRLAAPEVRRHRSWFWAYPLLAGLFYEEFKNTIARVAHLKQLMGERRWRVTARADQPEAVTETQEDGLQSRSGRHARPVGRRAG